MERITLEYKQCFYAELFNYGFIGKYFYALSKFIVEIVILKNLYRQ